VTTTPWTVAGKTVLITGASRGIGFEAALALAQLGAEVILAGRDRQRTDAALEAIRSRTRARATAYLCDFSSQAAIRGLATVVRRNHAALHVLVNNAGGVHTRRSVSVDGIETTFATNHLGYFLLTNLLLDLIVASAPARIVTVASIGHRNGVIHFHDLGLEHGYGIMKAYSQSKLANVLFAAELARRLEGTGVTSNSVHPGSVDTNIWTGAPLWAQPIIRLLFRPWFITAEKGGATIVQLAASPNLDGVTGQYFENQRPVEPSVAARDLATARRLWTVSAKLVGTEPFSTDHAKKGTEPDVL
jgi:NAD(P)-dependent dehydrogenase (short-subunit alcohol dehydrogenase family)